MSAATRIATSRRRCGWDRAWRGSPEAHREHVRAIRAEEPDQESCGPDQALGWCHRGASPDRAGRSRWPATRRSDFDIVHRGLLSNSRVSDSLVVLATTCRGRRREPFPAFRQLEPQPSLHTTDHTLCRIARASRARVERGASAHTDRESSTSYRLLDSTVPSRGPRGPPVSGGGRSGRLAGRRSPLGSDRDPSRIDRPRQNRP